MLPKTSDDLSLLNGSIAFAGINVCVLAGFCVLKGGRKSAASDYANHGKKWTCP